jgi:hypothetical protein
VHQQAIFGLFAAAAREMNDDYFGLLSDAMTPPDHPSSLPNLPASGTQQSHKLHNRHGHVEILHEVCSFFCFCF